MKGAKVFFAFLFLAVIVGAAYAGMSSNSWRYKMTVVVETPEGEKTGSAVREIVSHRAFNLTLGWVDRYKVSGEAIAVDLGKRGVLFGLTRGGKYGRDFAKNIYVDLYIVNKSTGKIILPFEQYPKFVRFADSKDPKTAEPVIELEKESKSPFKVKVKADRTEEFFGEGVKIKSVTIEPTEDVITNKIDQFLPSFSDDTGYRDWLRQLKYGDSRIVLPTDFKIEG